MKTQTGPWKAHDNISCSFIIHSHFQWAHQTYSLIFSPHTCAPTQHDCRLSKRHYHWGRNSSGNLGFIFVFACVLIPYVQSRSHPCVSSLTSPFPSPCRLFRGPASVVRSMEQITKWSFSFQTCPIVMTSPIAPRSIFLKCKMNHVALQKPLPA